MCMIFLFEFFSDIGQIYAKTIVHRYPEIFYTFEVSKLAQIATEILFHAFFA